MRTAPIALFAYNRPHHLRQTMEALRRNELAGQSDLHVFADGPKPNVDDPKVRAVREYLEAVSGFQSVNITARPKNLGLAQSIIDGVTEVCRSHGRVIVVEDDLVTSPFFLRYMNEALNLYEADPEVISIHAYVYPVQRALPETFFLKGADCWGWATWQRGWDLFNPDGRSLLAALESRKLTAAFDFDGSFGYTDMLKQQIAGTNNSWAIRWYASAFLAGKLTLYPGRSLVENIGHDTTGTHCGNSQAFSVATATDPVRVERQPLGEHAEARRAFVDFFRQQRRPSWSQRLRALLKRGAPS